MRWVGVLVVLVSGCCPKPAPEIRYVPLRVEVPVAVQPPAPPVFERQPLPVDSLPDNAPPAEVIRRLVATILQLQGEVKLRDEALSAYRRPSAAPPDPSPAAPTP